MFRTKMKIVLSAIVLVSVSQGKLEVSLLAGIVRLMLRRRVEVYTTATYDLLLSVPK